MQKRLINLLLLLSATDYDCVLDIPNGGGRRITGETPFRKESNGANGPGITMDVKGIGGADCEGEREGGFDE